MPFQPFGPGKTGGPLLIGKPGPAGPTGPIGPQGPPGPGTGAGAWQPTTAYTAAQVVQAPDGSMIRRAADGTSRATFDATEQAAWTAVLASAGTVENTALTATTVTVGETNLNVAAFASIAAALASAPSGAKRLWLTAPEYVEAGLALPSNTAIEGAGGKRVVIKAPPATTGGVITNADTVNGNDRVELKNLAIDGNVANQAGSAAAVVAGSTFCAYPGDGTDDGDTFGVRWERVTNWKLTDVDVYGVDGKGIYVIGGYDASSNPQQTKGFLSRVFAHDNGLEGIHIGRGMRRVFASQVRCESNARDGFWNDMSESELDGINCYGNGRDGIYFRNVGAVNAGNLVANVNGRHGIRVAGFVSGQGMGWQARFNGQDKTTPWAALTGGGTSADIFFDDRADMGYGVTDKSQVVGLAYGPPTNVLRWEGLGIESLASPTEDYGIYVADGVNGNVMLGDLQGEYGPAVAAVRLPADPGNLLVYGKVGSLGRLKMYAGSILLNGGRVLNSPSIAGYNVPTVATVTPGIGATGTPPPTVTGTDVRGHVSTGTGTGGTTTGRILAVTFARPYDSVPYVVLTPRNAVTAALGVCYIGATTTGFSIYTQTALAASQPADTYDWTYHVVS